MAAPQIIHVQEQLFADERLLHLKLQAQDEIVHSKGLRQDSAADHQIADAGLVASLVLNASFSIQQQLPPAAASSVTRTAPQPYSGTQAINQHVASVLAAVQQRWQKLITERLHAAQMLLPDMPLAATPRTAEELSAIRSQVAELTEAWERIGGHNSLFTGNIQAPNVGKLLYDAEDLLQAITTAVEVQQSHAAPGKVIDPSIGAEDPAAEQQQQQQLITTSLLHAVRAPSRVWLQSFFADLKADNRQVGIDDVLHSWFREQQVQQAHRAAASCSAATCRAAARTGLPASERPWVWATALGIHAAPPDFSYSSNPAPPADAKQQPSTRKGAAAGVAAPGSSSPASQQPATGAVVAAGRAASNRFPDWWRLPSQRDHQVLQLLCESVEQQVLLTDVLTCADVQRLADNEHYFVFEEEMRAILLALSRDPSVSRSAAVPAAPRLAAEYKGPQQLRPYPPSGILPFQGLALYLAPLCYVYEHPAAVYLVLAAMYCRYWSCLHTVNAKPAPSAGLPVLCKTFLELLQDVDADVYQHLSRLSSSPLDLAFPWILSGFTGFLSPSETLLLWDRIIGFDSLLVLPVLAVAVMTFRRDLVLAAASSDELLEVLEDLSQVRVVPLLQALLFDS